MFLAIRKVAEYVLTEEMAYSEKITIFSFFK